MEYRKLGRTGLSVSAIGLGTEYLNGRPQDEVVAVVHEAIDRGVNYFDVLFAGADYRDNLGAAFAGRRDRVLITGHIGCAETDGQYRKTRDIAECEELFADLLARLHTDHVDVLMIQFCDEEEDLRAIMAPGGMLELARRLRGEGKARAIGLSGHSVPVALQAVQSGAFDVLMFPVNIPSHGEPGREELYETCLRRNVGLVAMKPFAGGELLQRKEAPTVTPVQCLAYTLSRLGLATTVPGVKSLDELRAALAYLEACTEEKDFTPLLTALNRGTEGHCTYCNHCLPCPASIDIGETQRLLDSAGYGLTDELRAAYRALPAPAGDCLECGNCEERCPFHVAIIERLREAAHLFAS